MPDREVVRADVVEVAASIAAALTVLDDGQSWRSQGAKMSTEAVLYGPYGEVLRLDVGEYNWRHAGRLRFLPSLVDDLLRHVPADASFPAVRASWRDNPREVAARLLQALPALREVLARAVTARGEDLALVEQARGILGADAVRLADTTAICRVDFGDLRKPMSGHLHLRRGGNVMLQMAVPVGQVPAVLTALAPLISAGAVTEKAE